MQRYSVTHILLAAPPLALGNAATGGSSSAQGLLRSASCRSGTVCTRGVERKWNTGKCLQQARCVRYVRSARHVRKRDPPFFLLFFGLHEAHHLAPDGIVRGIGAVRHCVGVASVFRSLIVVAMIAIVAELHDRARCSGL